MRSRKEIFQLIAQRYGFGYAEIYKKKEKEICITGPVLPNLESGKQKLSKLVGLKSEALNDLFRVNKPGSLYSRLGASVNTYSKMNNISNTQIFCGSPEEMLSNEEIDQIIFLMDNKCQPSELKTSSEVSESTRSLPIFNHCQVRTKNPITFGGEFPRPDLVRLPFYGGKYSLILNFLGPENLSLFLSCIAPDAKNSFATATYVTYVCNYEKGCYQILIPYGHEYQAINLLLGNNYFLADLPIVRYLVNSLQPKSFLSSLVTASIKDEHFSVALIIIQKLFEKQLKVSLDDFDPLTRTIITSNVALKTAFSATIEYFTNSAQLINRHLPDCLTNIILGYRMSI